MVVVILTGHAPLRRHLYIMGLFGGDPTCRFCRMEAETVQHIICCCEALARHRYNIFGKLIVEPKDISTASVRDLCLFIRGTGLLNLCWMESLGLYNKPKADVDPGHKLTGPKEEEEAPEFISFKLTSSIFDLQDIDDIENIIDFLFQLFLVHSCALDC
jgi:hypothetical protein